MCRCADVPMCRCADVLVREPVGHIARPASRLVDPRAYSGQSGTGVGMMRASYSGVPGKPQVLSGVDLLK